MEPKRFVITDCLSNGDAIAAHMTQSEVGTWVSYDDPAIAADRAIAQAAREAGLVKDGKLMPMIGKLQVTADNCVILDREVAIHLPMVNGDVYTASAGCAARMDHWYANREAAMKASKAESAARSAAEAEAKGEQHVQ